MAEIQYDKHNFNWPPLKPKFIENFGNYGVDVFEEMYGALDDTDPNSPYTRISMANSSFSLDPSVGCPETCFYCVRLSNLKDGLAHNNQFDLNRVFATPVNNLFSGNVLVQSLSKHPAFIPNKSVISISTGSSEAFVSSNSETTWSVLEELMQKNLRNPVWVVTKSGIPAQSLQEWVKRFQEITDFGIPFILSVTSSGMPKQIERNQTDRFKFVEAIKATGIHISHHLRPIIRGINSSETNLRSQLTRSLPLVASVCLGGLRVDPGIIISWREAGKLDLDLLPNKQGEKDLPDETIFQVRNIMDELGYENTPLFLKSSHVISNATHAGDYNLYEYRPATTLVTGHLLDIHPNINEKIREVYNLDPLELVRRAAERIGLSYLDFRFERINGIDRLICDPSLKDYRTHRALIHSIGHSGILPTNIYELQRFT